MRLEIQHAQEIRDQTLFTVFSTRCLTAASVKALLLKMNCDLLLTVSLTHLCELDGGLAVKYFSSVIRITSNM